MDKKKSSNNTPFENKLLSRLESANERLKQAEDIECLRNDLTIRRMKVDFIPRRVSADDIKQVRRTLGASQAVFALFIQVPLRTLQEWEQGRAEVSGCAAILIGEMLCRVAYWKERFAKAFETA